MPIAARAGHDRAAARFVVLYRRTNGARKRVADAIAIEIDGVDRAIAGRIGVVAGGVVIAQQPRDDSGIGPRKATSCPSASPQRSARPSPSRSATLALIIPLTVCTSRPVEASTTRRTPRSRDNPLNATARSGQPSGPRPQKSGAADAHHALLVELEAVPPERVAVVPRDCVKIDRFRLFRWGVWFTGGLAAVEPREDDQVARAVVVEVGRGRNGLDSIVCLGIRAHGPHPSWLARGTVEQRDAPIVSCRGNQA